MLELTEESAAEGTGDAALDAELVEMVDALGTRLGALELQSLFSGEYDEFDAVCEVHAGAGGTDAQDWTEVLLRMYQRWAERRGFTVEVDEATEGQEAGLLSATFIVHGRFAYGLLATERGVHRLVRMSPFDSQHRRQTSFASMDVTPFLEDVSSEVEIDEKDLRIDTYRSSGAGGQHVNKTDSAVRLTHLPTGLVVSCQNERSQHQNKAKAMQILGAKLADRARMERRAELDALSGDRGRQRVGEPDPLVRDGAVPTRQGSPHQLRDGQCRGGARRRPRCVHGGGAPPPARGQLVSRRRRRRRRRPRRAVCVAALRVVPSCTRRERRCFVGRVMRREVATASRKSRTLTSRRSTVRHGDAAARASPWRGRPVRASYGAGTTRDPRHVSCARRAQRVAPAGGPCAVRVLRCHRTFHLT